MNPTEAIQRLRDVIRRQHKALATEESYVHWLRRYMAAIRHLPNSLPSEKKVEWFLTALARRGNVAASTQNQAFNAILFAYKHEKGSLPHIQCFSQRGQSHTYNCGENSPASLSRSRSSCALV